MENKEKAVKVVITGVCIPIGDLVLLLVMVVLASIPAMLILMFMLFSGLSLLSSLGEMLL